MKKHDSQLNIRISKGTHDLLRKIAKKRNVRPSDLARKFIEECIESEIEDKKSLNQRLEISEKKIIEMNDLLVKFLNQRKINLK